MTTAVQQSCRCACHRTFGVVEFTEHAIQRLAERLPGIHAATIAGMVRDGLLTDWRYLPEWYRVAPWSKRDNDRYIEFRMRKQDVIAVVAADRGRGQARVVKTIVTEDCAHAY